MRLVFYASDKPREQRVAEALREGAAAYGDSLEIKDAAAPTTRQTDAACMFGIKSYHRLHHCWRHGIHTVLFDKPYTRSTKHWRVAVDSIQPIDSFQVGRPSDRWDKLGLALRHRQPGRQIIFAGSSAKFHRAVNIRPPTDYAETVVKRLRRRTQRPIIYRPKPSWHEAEPVEGADMRRDGPLSALLDGAHLLVTWGSSAAVDAIVAGVPVLALGDTIALPISERNMKSVERPFFPGEKQRRQWCHDLAYCQWTLDELRSGEAWQHIRPLIWPALAA